jgi:hypothetical protein
MTSCNELLIEFYAWMSSPAKKGVEYGICEREILTYAGMGNH